MPALRTRDTQSRPLDVATDPSQPPTLNIVSPTPRAFTFPASHNLSSSDSPYSSPSNSPFEPDLRSNQPIPSASTSTPPPPPIRTLSPEPASARSSSPAPSSHKRRKSSCSSDVDRRPKKGDEDYIKRPENAFILFRRKCCEDRQQAQEEAASADAPTKKQRQADLSKTISQQWKSLSGEERQYWEQLAKDKKKEHEQLYPNYVYRPQRAKDKDGRAKKKSSKKLDSEMPESLSFIVPTVPRPHGRSASAPTPPPYQSIQVPNVYQLTPSCPTSPSLLPMISRRSAHPGHSDDPLASFDYMPTNTFSSFPAPGQFESSFQSSEFLRSMFTAPLPTHRNNSTTHLQQLNMASSESLLLPSRPPTSVVSPATSSGSSSGPSSPKSGPYTPISAPSVPQNYALFAADAGLDAQQQQDLDLQLEMQMQQEFAAFSWGSHNGSLWSMDPPELLSSDFDLNSIPPIELGGKFADAIAPSPAVSLASDDSAALEFGREFTHTIESRPFNHSGILGFDEMMAGHGF